MDTKRRSTEKGNKVLNLLAQWQYMPIQWELNWDVIEQFDIILKKGSQA
jgi:hypothetical protein